MGVILLGIGDIGASRNPDDIIKTMALGSCVGLIFMDPTTRTIGLAHIALPDSSIAANPEDVRRLPGRFVDTGVPALLKLMKQTGANSDPTKYVSKLVGGANIMDSNNTFKIGQRNILAVKKLLWGLGSGIVAEDTGKNMSRTVTITLVNGIVTLSSPGRGEWKV
jgi:chemotaxis protein CheD